MLTKLTVKGFKNLVDVEIELGQSVVFVGPNNAGKTSALQALTLWNIGLKQWQSRREGRAPERRSGVTLNRRELVAIPVPEAGLLWNKLYTRDVRRINGKPQTRNIRIEIIVEGVTEADVWRCGLEFDYANNESLYCRPLRQNDAPGLTRMLIPPQTLDVSITLLPPMSGLIATEDKLGRGSIERRIGEGRTADVLRNLCYMVFESNSSTGDWDKLKGYIETMFGVELLEPVHIPSTGEVKLQYKERNTPLDLSSSGRGMLQVMLLLSYMFINPKTVLLLDEPDAHLEILRQRQIYNLINTVAGEQGSQIIMATHSEIVMDTAFEKEIVIAFVGKPHRANKKDGIVKALRLIPFDHYFQAEQTGWVFYIEGTSDLSILRAFAERLSHPAVSVMDRLFSHPVDTNQPQKAREHFYGLREAKPDLVGYALFDRLEKNLGTDDDLTIEMWRRREIENYLTTRETLLAYAEDHLGGLGRLTMEGAIDTVAAALNVLSKPAPWSPDIKVSDDFLVPLFDRYFADLNLPNLMRKTNFHVLARFVPPDQIDPEVTEKLDAIYAVAQRATPRQD